MGKNRRKKGWRKESRQRRDKQKKFNQGPLRGQLGDLARTVVAVGKATGRISTEDPLAEHHDPPLPPGVDNTDD